MVLKDISCSKTNKKSILPFRNIMHNEKNSTFTNNAGKINKLTNSTGGPLCVISSLKFEFIDFKNIQSRQKK